MDSGNQAPPTTGNTNVPPVDWSQIQRRAEAMDEADVLAPVRDQFYLPADKIYLDGNSLGPIPHAAFQEIDTAVRTEWAEDLIESWNTADWFLLPEQYGDGLAPVLGAGPGEVVVCDTTSSNLFKLLSAALQLRQGRSVIVAEGGGFPTDLYMIEGVSSVYRDVEVRLQGVDGDRLEDLIDGDVAVVLCNHVDYRTGRVRDMAELTARAHAAGALILWDLCHSAGVVPIHLNRDQVDLAVGCTYKYLNGGPGSPAFLFAAQRHLPHLRQPLSGWWGHKDPFAFSPNYAPDGGIRKFLCGTQPILSFRAAKAGLEMYSRLDMTDVRKKSMQLTDFFIELMETHGAGFGLTCASPREVAARGSQVSYHFKHGYAVIQALIAAGVIADFRAPDIMRFGFSPLYIRFQDVAQAVEQLHTILAEERWRHKHFQTRAKVT